MTWLEAQDIIAITNNNINILKYYVNIIVTYWEYIYSKIKKIFLTLR